MSLTYPTDTLAYHMARPLVTSRDASDVPCQSVAWRVKDFMKQDQDSGTKPERDAMWFYCLNHGMALLKQELHPLQPMTADEKDFVDSYHRLIGPKAVRAFYYLLLICTRESRHVQNISKLKAAIEKKFGLACYEFIRSIQNSSSTGAYQTFLDSPPAIGIGPYVQSLQYVFYNGYFPSGFGGPAWGKVADCLVSFVTGEYTPEIMLDTIWTLCHNNGPIFNKGMLYGTHSSRLTMLLDIQRSGQIPESVIEPVEDLKHWIAHGMTERVKWLRQRFPGKIGSYVDWEKVHALGSVNKYHVMLKVQQAKHGLSPEEKAKAEQAKKAKELQEAAAKMAEQQMKEAFYELTPGVLIPKIKRAA